MTRREVFPLSTSSPAPAPSLVHAPAKPLGPRDPDQELVDLVQELKAYEGREPTARYATRKRMRALMREIAAMRAWGLAGWRAKAEALAFVMHEDRFEKLEKEASAITLSLFAVTVSNSGQPPILDRERYSLRATRANTLRSREAIVEKGPRAPVDRDDELAALARRFDAVHEMLEVPGEDGKPVGWSPSVDAYIGELVDQIRAIPAYGETGLRAKMEAFGWAVVDDFDFSEGVPGIGAEGGAIARAILTWLNRVPNPGIASGLRPGASTDAMMVAWAAELRRLVAVDAALPRNALRPTAAINAIGEALAWTSATTIQGYRAKAAWLRYTGQPERRLFPIFQEHYGTQAAELIFQVLDRMTDDVFPA